MTVVVETHNPTKASGRRPTSLLTALREIESKRGEDVIRFRTCCADPRASK